MIETVALGARAGRFALHDVSLLVPAGTYAVVLGRAGAGKTTLLETIAGVVRASTGIVRLGGRDVTRLPPEHRDVALVYQHAYLFPHLTAAANIAYGAPDAAAARAAAEIVGVSVLGARDVRGLSGGERQLVAVARALARRPRVLLLDEPYGALDLRRRAMVRRRVRDAARDAGMTVLHVTHDLAEARLLGAIGVLLDGGQMIQHGAIDLLFGAPATAVAAELVGIENVWAVRAVGDDRDRWFEITDSTLRVRREPRVGATPSPTHLLLRAEHMSLHAEEPTPTRDAAFCAAVRVREIEHAGAVLRVTLEADGTELRATVAARAADTALPALREGAALWATASANDLHWR